MTHQNVPADVLDEILNARHQDLSHPPEVAGGDDEVAEEDNADEASSDVGEVEVAASEEVETKDGHEQPSEESSTSSSESDSESGDEEAATEEVAEEAGNEDDHEEAAAEGGNEEAEEAAEGVEPLWCICQNVEHGNMVACDNPNCPHQWFHYSCVGLKSAPRGKLWYCPNCSQKSSKK